MPTPPPPTTVQGAVVRLLQADAGLLALVPAGNVVAGEEAEERDIGAGFVLVHDDVENPRWVTTVNRIELHRLRVNVYAPAAGVVGADNPAEAVAANVERAVNWADLPIPNTVPMRFEQTGHALTLERRRTGAKERVYKCALSWEVELYYRVP
jgi:hypothetical protein